MFYGTKCSRKPLKNLNVANVPQKALSTSRTSVDDVQGDDADSTKSSKDAGDDATNDDSLHHVLKPPFMMKNIYYKTLDK